MLAMCLCGCKPASRPYAPPLQRVFDPNSEPAIVGEMISMESPQADGYIVRGTITNEPGAKWRWCEPRLDLRFQLSATQGLKYFMDFVINENTFAKTGPVHFRFTLDGKPIGEARYDTPGIKRFETPVAAELLRTDQPVVVTAEADKFILGETDRVKLAFLVVSAGFRL
ncbi:MAG: hypothetical protein JNL98_08125 [Bryobacterales bacterium]|nr:hypothetical protein [Bryobacterales bacterium]